MDAPPTKRLSKLLLMRSALMQRNNGGEISLAPTVSAG